MKLWFVQAERENPADKQESFVATAWGSNEACALNYFRCIHALRASDPATAGLAAKLWPGAQLSFTHVIHGGWDE
jgi:hypothetical protein